MKLWPKMERAPCPCLRYCIVTFATSPTTIAPCFMGGIWVEIKRRGLRSSIDCQPRLLPTLFCFSYTLHVCQLPTHFLHWSNFLADPLALFCLLALSISFSQSFLCSLLFDIFICKCVCVFPQMKWRINVDIWFGGRNLFPFRYLLHFQLVHLHSI